MENGTVYDTLLRAYELLSKDDWKDRFSRIPDKTFYLLQTCIRSVTPPPRLTVSEWADKYRILPDTSPEPGQWRTDRTPYLKDPMDACSDPHIRRVVMMFCVQVGKSEVENNVAGYFIDQDPSPMMMIQPSEGKAMDYSKERIAPMINDCPALQAKIKAPKGRDSGNTIMAKEFPGGRLALVGAESPKGLASRPVRIVLADELDRFPLSAGTEGAPLALAEKRTSNFWNKLIFISSTPTNKGESAIEAEYEQSTKEQWCVPCPSCGELQPFEWGRLIFDSVEMACRKCGALHSEFEWKSRPGKWIAQSEHPTTRGFHLNAMASPWLSWDELIAEFRDANEKGPEVLKTFINTRLAETWEKKGESLDEDLLDARRHYYNCDVPAEVLMITAGVDVQEDRLELEVVGWGYGAESWGIQYAVIPGDPHKAAVWESLDEYLQTVYRCADGRILPISCTCVDSGYATTDVYSFCRKRFARYIFAIKGQGGPGLPEVGPYRRQGKNKNVAVFPVGTGSSKDTFSSRLKVETEGGGFCHWPRESELSNGELRGYGTDYFKGLMAEKRVERRAQGRIYHTWVKRSSHARNEALDCRVYASAALRILNPKWEEIGKSRSDRAQEQTRMNRRRRRRTISSGVSV
ncbi:MAG: phage terminase large subunit family protein [Armatimonadota bacterium]